MAIGTVKFFKADRGWGAIASDALPPDSDAFAHYSVIEDSGYRELAAGEVVDFDFEVDKQRLGRSCRGRRINCLAALAGW